MLLSSGNRNAYRLFLIMLVIALLIGSIPSTASATTESTGALQETDHSESITTAATVDDMGPYYEDVLQKWEQLGVKDAAASSTFQAIHMSKQSDNTKTTATSYEGMDQSLIWENDQTGWIEYNVQVAETGLYELELQYHPFMEGDSNRDIPLKVTVDGQLQYREAGAITLNRHWKDSDSIRTDGQGDQIRPLPVQINEWISEPLKDTEGAYSSPLKWYLTAGMHTIRFESYESVALHDIRLKAPQKIASYEEAASAYPKVTEQPSEIIRIEAEQMTWKTASSIRMETDQDPMTSPEADGNIVFNHIDGWSWWRGGQQAGWTFEVPQSGMYTIALRVFQQHYSNKSSYRTVYIDGKVPFEELSDYRFPYKHGWYGETLGSTDDKPYQIYLEKGKHTLAMEVTHAPVTPIIIGLEQLINILRSLDEDMRLLTGGVTDRNRTWSKQELADIEPKLEEGRQLSERLAASMLEANGKRDDITAGLESVTREFKRFLKAPTELPNNADRIVTLLDKVSSFNLNITQQQLGIDQIYIVPSQLKAPKMKAGFMQKLVSGVRHFFISFKHKDNVSQIEEGKLNVWVLRGRDYANLIQEMADEMFTPASGISVKVNLITDPNLLVLANAAGIQPDVAMGVPQDRPFDYALRNAIVDLKQFDDFDEVASSYAPGALLPYYYNGGYYGLPETQSFNVLFYRKDILEKLGLKVPQTWDDVNAMLPTLQQNQYNFFYNRSEFLPFIYQNGAQFFAANGMKQSLSTPESFTAFKQWTDLYSIYGLKKEVPSFYEHFRRGTLPIGVADYNMYIQLLVAAPELNGRWGIAPLPGIKQPDGQIARWASGGQNADLIYKKSGKQEEAWKFMKWWLSADVQEQYGTSLEAFNGPEFRWNTANIEAFTHMPWKREDLNVILEQWKWFKEMPQLPGSYIVSREMNNAWNRAVIDHMNYRTSLERSITEIDREMTRKQREFHLIDDDGNYLQTLDLPQIMKPWEEAEKYVKQ